MPRALIRLAATVMLLVASAAAFAETAFAESWPTKPIRVIVCYAPGGVTDVVARLVAQPLSEEFGQSIVV